MIIAVCSLPLKDTNLYCGCRKRKEGSANKCTTTKDTETIGEKSNKKPKLTNPTLSKGHDQTTGNGDDNDNDNDSNDDNLLPQDFFAIECNVSYPC